MYKIKCRIALPPLLFFKAVFLPGRRNCSSLRCIQCHVDSLCIEAAYSYLDNEMNTKRNRALPRFVEVSVVDGERLFDG